MVLEKPKVILCVRRDADLQRHLALHQIAHDGVGDLTGKICCSRLHNLSLLRKKKQRVSKGKKMKKTKHVFKREKSKTM